MSANAPPDDLRDAHLVAALRHAPDRDVAPPAQLTASILDQARQALHAQRRPREPLRAAWARLWHPAPLAAFGTLALATVIGVMWGGQPVPDATPSLRPESVAAAPAADAQLAASAVPAPVAAPDRMERAAVQQRKPEAKPQRSLGQTPPVAPQARRAPGDAVADRGPTEPLAAESRTVSPAVVPAAPRPPRTEPQTRRDAFAKSSAEAAPAEARARSEPPAERTTELASERVARQLGAAAPGVLAPLAQAGLEIDSAAGSDPARVRWRLPQRSVAHDAAQRDWWAALVGSTQGHWQRAGAAPAGAGEAALTLMIDGASRGSLGFEPEAVVWRDANGVVWRAAVAAPTLRAWQEAVARW